MGRPKGARASTFHRWAPDELAYMKEIVPGRSYAEITKLVNERFSMDLKTTQISSCIGNHRMNTGLTGRFEKGSVPANKGLKGICAPGSEKGWFPKDGFSHNRREIGSERTGVDGYVYVKVQDGRKNLNWRAKHIVIWEEANGPLEPGCVLIFANGDRGDVRLDNLLLAERADLATMNRLGLKGHDRESTQAAILTSMLVRLGRKRRREAP